MSEKSNLFGSTIRTVRVKNNILIRQVAAALEVDTAFISKVERGAKRISREQVVKIASYFTLPKERLIDLWLADKIVDTIEGEERAIQAINIVTKRLKQ